MTITLWHCTDARSFRPLWALEEMQLDYTLKLLPFPPRVRDKGFLDINPLGTVPFMTDGEASMTESSGMCHYLAERYAPEFCLPVEHPEYADFLNWMYHSDATLTFPQTLILRYARFEPEERRQPQVAADYRHWYLARLRKLDSHLLNHEFLCGNKFTVADIAIGYALMLGEMTGAASDYTEQTQAYLARLKDREGFARAKDKQQE